MKIAINQAYFFPYIGYFQLIHSVDKFILYEHVNFIKNGWMTRNRVLPRHTDIPVYINMPVYNSSSNRIISSIEITREQKKWKRKFLIILSNNYGRAPHFSTSFSFLRNMVESVDTASLHEFNAFFIQAICQYLDIDTKIQYYNEHLLEIEKRLSFEYEYEYEGNVLNKVDKKTQRVIYICKQEKAQTYVNLPGGRALYDKTSFSDQQIELQFVEPCNDAYVQYKHPFISHLSIIDVLMHNGKEGAKELIKNYQLL